MPIDWERAGVLGQFITDPETLPLGMRPRADGTYGLGMVGGVPLKGVLGPAHGLPMDTASRMARAKGSGVHINMPLYHGTADDFTAFDPAKRGATSGAAPARTAGAWASLDPETANEFANLAAKATGGNPAVMPLLHRAKKPAVIDLDGSETNQEIAATLDDTFSRGYDAVMFRNYTTPAGKSGKTIVAVRDPEQLRSRFAAFDPSKVSSRDLLASVAAAFGGALVMDDDGPAGARERK